MHPILGQVRYSVKDKLCKHLRRCRNAGVRVRYLIIINLLNDRSAYETAEVLGVHNTTVYRVARRFRAAGEWGLWDAREDNGTTKLDEHYLTVLHRVVRQTPQQYGWRRPTWTRELLVETMVRETGVRIHVTTMSRALALVEARRGRPRPTGRTRQNLPIFRTVMRKSWRPEVAPEICRAIQWPSFPRPSKTSRCHIYVTQRHIYVMPNNCEITLVLFYADFHKYLDEFALGDRGGASAKVRRHA
jgi:transposase